MVERAKHEAESIVAKAAKDAEAQVDRRKAMAEANIAAEERAAVDQLRAAAANAATAAAAKLIAERSDAKTDKNLVDQAIASLTK
jgi:F-type H+-transporting ATPase subunit b